MTNISKTSQLIASNSKNALQTSSKVSFESSKTQIALQSSQASNAQIAIKQNTIKHVRPPSTAQNTIIKTNTKFNLAPQNSLPRIKVPTSNFPRTLPSTQLAPKMSAGVAALGVGEFATAAKMTTGGIITTGILTTVALASSTFLSVFLYDTKGFDMGEDDTLKKLKAKKPKKPQLKPLRHLPLGPFIEENEHSAKPFIPKYKPRPFQPIKKLAPLPLAQPASYKPVPNVPSIPHVHGVELAPVMPNYVGARRDVEQKKTSDKKAKGQVRNSADKSQQASAAKDQATSPQTEQPQAKKRISAKEELNVTIAWAREHGVDFELMKNTASQAKEIHDLTAKRRQTKKPKQYHWFKQMGRLKYAGENGIVDAPNFGVTTPNAEPVREVKNSQEVLIDHHKVTVPETHEIKEEQKSLSEIKPSKRAPLSDKERQRKYRANLSEN
jgi:hypothetical protein